VSVERPELMNAAFADGYNARDVDALLGLYEPTATVVNRDGSLAIGSERVREHLAGLVSLGGRMTSTNRYAIVHDDIALVGAEWEIDLEDGRAPIRGSTSEVLRRQPDGSWRYVIDHPIVGPT
jgi:ketosteroid isomerase-like protein